MCACEKSRDHLGTTRSEGARHAEQDAFLPCEQLLHVDSVARSALVDAHRGERIADLEAAGSV